MKRRTESERGAVSVMEFVIVVPVLFVLLMFIVGLGRMADARGEVEAGAADAARAASLERNKSHSADQARAAAKRSLGEAGLSCTNLAVTVDISSYEPGGRVQVSVRCRANLKDVAIVGLPGAREFTATSTVPIETYRGS